jgi:predicted nucleic acid-binding protein
VVAADLTDKHLYLDASCLIYILENPVGFPSYVQFLTEFYTGRFRLATSAITLAEVLVQPIKLGRADLEREYQRFLTPSDVLSVITVDSAVSIRAAQLRAAHNLRAPDAIHIATGLIAGCDLFLTNDLAWAKAGIPVVTPF